MWCFSSLQGAGAAVVYNHNLDLQVFVRAVVDPGCQQKPSSVAEQPRSTYADFDFSGFVRNCDEKAVSN
jgi:hypothetical protein